MSFSRADNVALFAVTVSGRTLTPTGNVFIGDMRKRTPHPNGWVTLNGNTNGGQYDIYTQTFSGDRYTLAFYPIGTDMSARTDLLRVGTAIDYPANGTAMFIPLSGGTLDAYLYVAADGLHIRPFASNIYQDAYAALILDPAVGGGTSLFLHTVNGGATIQPFVPGEFAVAFLSFIAPGAIQMQSSAQVGISAAGNVSLGSYGSGSTVIAPANSGGITNTFDAGGRQRKTQSSSPSNSVNAAVAGTGASANVVGTDEWGRINLTTGTGPTGGNQPLLTVTFASALVTVPYGVTVAPANLAAQSLARNQDVAAQFVGVGTGNFIVYAGSVALGASTLYQWTYRVLIA